MHADRGLPPTHHPDLSKGRCVDQSDGARHFHPGCAQIGAYHGGVGNTRHLDDDVIEGPTSLHSKGSKALDRGSQLPRLRPAADAAVLQLQKLDGWLPPRWLTPWRRQLFVDKGAHGRAIQIDGGHIVDNYGNSQSVAVVEHVRERGRFPRAQKPGEKGHRWAW